MKSLLRSTLRFLAAEDGPTAVEYAMMTMLILLAAISAVTLLGQATATSLDESKESIVSATGR